MTSPKVSVIVPNYNHATFLRKRLVSVLEQTFQDFEIIYLDDASTDNSSEVFSEFQNDTRICIAINEKNSGSPFKQWNKGVLLAKGEYVWIAEADDFSEKTFLEVLVKILDENPSVGIAYCKSWQVDANDAVQKVDTKGINGGDGCHWLADYTNKGQDECRDYLLHENTILNASAVLFRRDVFLEAGMADESLRIAGDWLTWVNMLLISDIAYVSAPLNYFRKHVHSVRDKTLWDGTLIKENYIVFGHFKRSLKIPERFLEIRLDAIMYDLVKIITAKNNAITLYDLCQIWNTAKGEDSKIIRRFIRIFFNFIYGKIINRDTRRN